MAVTKVTECDLGTGHQHQVPHHDPAVCSTPPPAGKAEVVASCDHHLQVKFFAGLPRRGDDLPPGRSLGQ